MNLCACIGLTVFIKAWNGNVLLVSSFRLFFSINIWTRPALFVRDERYAFFHTQVCQRAGWFGERICKRSQETSGQVSQHRGIWSAYCESEKKLSFRNKKMQINTFCKVHSKRQKERCSAWVFTDILLQVINRDNWRLWSNDQNYSTYHNFMHSFRHCPFFSIRVNLSFLRPIFHICMISYS